MEIQLLAAAAAAAASSDTPTAATFLDCESPPIRAKHSQRPRMSYMTQTQQMMTANNESHAKLTLISLTRPPPAAAMNTSYLAKSLTKNGAKTACTASTKVVFLSGAAVLGAS